MMNVVINKIFLIKLCAFGYLKSYLSYMSMFKYTILYIFIFSYIIPADLKKFSIAKHIFLCNVENILNIKANFLNRNKFIVSYNTRCSRIKKNLKKLGTNFEKKDEFVVSLHHENLVLLF